MGTWRSQRLSLKLLQNQGFPHYTHIFLQSLAIWVESQLQLTCLVTTGGSLLLHTSISMDVNQVGQPDWLSWIH